MLGLGHWKEDQDVMQSTYPGTPFRLKTGAALDKGDLDGQRVWLRILAAVNELLDTRPGDGAAVH